MEDTGESSTPLWHIVPLGADKRHPYLCTLSTDDLADLHSDLLHEMLGSLKIYGKWIFL